MAMILTDILRQCVKYGVVSHNKIIPITSMVTGLQNLGSKVVIEDEHLSLLEITPEVISNIGSKYTNEEPYYADCRIGAHLWATAVKQKSTLIGIPLSDQGVYIDLALKTPDLFYIATDVIPKNSNIRSAIEDCASQWLFWDGKTCIGLTDKGYSEQSLDEWVKQYKQSVVDVLTVPDNSVLGTACGIEKILYMSELMCSQANIVARQPGIHQHVIVIEDAYCSGKEVNINVEDFLQ